MNLEKARRIAELADERVRLLERLAEITAEMAIQLGLDEMPAPTPRPVPSAPRSVRDTTKLDLPAILTTSATEHQQPLRIADFVRLARQAGYITGAKDFPNMVYQAILKLVRRGVLRKDRDNGSYSLGSTTYP